MITTGLHYRNLEDDPDQHYYLYVPSNGGIGKKLFVSIHGISRNADEHANHFASFAEKYDVVMVVPLFSKERFADYNTLGLTGQGERPDLALEKIISEVEQLTGAHTDSIFLFGYSAGGQFAHRYAMAYPERIVRLVVAAAGWYTFPETTVLYPRGIQLPAEISGVTITLDDFLHIPVCVLVGELDTELGGSLRQSPEVNEQQGTNRLERGRRWLTVIQQAAQSRRFTTEYRFATLPKSAHNFVQCMGEGMMGQNVLEFLFGCGNKEIEK
ncbi:hypothetical protein GC093_23600 [Paenibacillus sp. LMG 31456]|uniref:Alpha/beta hydrolase n=1 Tax=Paenibacillus foliorum TaxID=2654974 RepID=A0A972K3R4_9BACL|nr:PHB depolymerase family esterase [Paenibacillus foliorum]NOU96188.1 hypothetical protein [Paenibacillus foliorum]